MFKTLLETTLFLSFDLALDGNVFEDANRYYYMQKLYEMLRKSEPRREIRRIDGVLLYCTFSIDRNSSSMRLNFRRRSQAIIKRHAAKPEKISKYSSIFPITLQHTTRLYRWRMHQHTFDCTAQLYCLFHLDNDSRNCVRAITCALSSTIYNLILIFNVNTYWCIIISWNTSLKLQNFYLVFQ